MAEPTLADVRQDNALTDFSAAYVQADESFAYRRFAPIRPVPQQGGKYYVWSQSDFFRPEARKRAPNTEAAVRDFSLSSGTYYCDVYAVAFDVSEQVRANQDPAVDIEEAAAMGLAQDLMLRAELDFATALLNTASVWGTDASVTTTWDDPASDPIGDIATGIKTVAKNIGRRPNKILLGADVWYDGLYQHPDILARLADNSPRLITRDFIAGLFELDEVLVTQAAYEASDEGATSSIGFVGGKHAVIAYVDPSPGLNSPTAAVTFSWAGLLGAAPNGIRAKRMMLPEKDALPRIELDHAYDFKATSSVAGYRIASAVA